MESKSVSKIYTLNKTTYINLRWIAILGQFLTVNVVKYVFNFEFNILIVNVVIILGVISNIILILKYKISIIKGRKMLQTSFFQCLHIREFQWLRLMMFYF